MALEVVELNPGSGGSSIGVDVVNGAAFEVVKQAFGSEGEVSMVAANNPLPMADAAVLAKLTANPATSIKQDEQTALITTLNSLIETNNYLVQFLTQLTGAMNSGQPALRTIPIASVSTAVTGSVTATVASTVVSSVTNFGTGIPATEMAHDINNYTAIVANINNVTA